jgi:hypothetical protein
LDNDKKHDDFQSFKFQKSTIPKKFFENTPIFLALPPCKAIGSMLK